MLRTAGTLSSLLPYSKAMTSLSMHAIDSNQRSADDLLRVNSSWLTRSNCQISTRDEVAETLAFSESGYSSIACRGSRLLVESEAYRRWATFHDSELLQHPSNQLESVPRKCRITIPCDGLLRALGRMAQFEVAVRRQQPPGSRGKLLVAYGDQWRARGQYPRRPRLCQVL